MPITGVTIAVSASPVCKGSNVTLSAATATGTPTTYGWFRNGVFLQIDDGAHAAARVGAAAPAPATTR